jgi:hypothetical protein
MADFKRPQQYIKEKSIERIRKHLMVCEPREEQVPLDLRNKIQRILHGNRTDRKVQNLVVVLM